MALSYRLTPLSDAVAEEVRVNLVKYWNAIDLSSDLSGVPGDFVQEIQARVTELLQSNQVGDVYEAGRLTAWFEYRRQEAS